MAFTHSAVAPRHLSSTHSFNVRGWLRQLFDAMTETRLRQAEREVARYLVETGGKFTDEAEREIERRFMTNQSRW